MNNAGIVQKSVPKENLQYFRILDYLLILISNQQTLQQKELNPSQNLNVLYTMSDICRYVEHLNI